MGEIYQSSVIIPAFNEAENLSPLLDLCAKTNWKRITINGGSSHNTKVIQGTIADTNHIAKIITNFNKGYGAAIKNGIVACDTKYVMIAKQLSLIFSGQGK